MRHSAHFSLAYTEMKVVSAPYPQGIHKIVVFSFFPCI